MTNSETSAPKIEIGYLCSHGHYRFAGEEGHFDCWDRRVAKVYVEAYSLGGSKAELDEAHASLLVSLESAKQARGAA